MRCAYGDESFHEDPLRGFYVLAAAVFEPHALDEARELLLNMRDHHRVPKLHWTKMDDAEQLRTTKQLAELDGLHVVVVGSPVPQRQQERARALCLTRLVTELHTFEVDTLILEGRENELNRRDTRTVAGARQSLLGKEARFRVEHSPGALQPLLWAADVVAGACRAEQEGRSEYRRALDERIYDIHLDTGC